MKRIISRANVRGDDDGDDGDARARRVIVDRDGSHRCGQVPLKVVDDIDGS